MGLTPGYQVPKLTLHYTHAHAHAHAHTQHTHTNIIHNTHTNTHTQHTPHTTHHIQHIYHTIHMHKHHSLTHTHTHTSYTHTDTRPQNLKQQRQHDSQPKLTPTSFLIYQTDIVFKMVSKRVFSLRNFIKYHLLTSIFSFLLWLTEKKTNFLIS